MSEDERSALRLLLSFLFAVIGGILWIWASFYLAFAAATAANNASTDKTGMGAFFILWFISIPLQFLFGGYLGFKSIDWIHAMKNMYVAGNVRKTTTDNKPDQ